MMKQILLILFFSPLFLFGQIDSIIDSRDDETYETILIGNTIWLKDYLRYSSKKSEMHIHVRGNDSIKVNYYSNSELDSICPKGWHVASIENWKGLIKNLVNSRQIPSTRINSDTLPSPNNSIIVTIDSLGLLTDTLLSMFPTGWVEGRKLTNKKTLTLWVKNQHIVDNKFHVHISEDRYIIHTHNHNIIDKRRKVRRFPVRCVCELVNKNKAENRVSD